MLPTGIVRRTRISVSVSQRTSRTSVHYTNRSLRKRMYCAPPRDPAPDFTGYGAAAPSSLDPSSKLSCPFARSDSLEETNRVDRKAL